MKKLFALILALSLVLSMCAAMAEPVDAASLKIGYILIGDENEGYSANHLNALYTAMDALGLDHSQALVKFNTPESEAAYEAAVDLAEQGCNIIFATSFGHESHLMQAAEEYPEIEFCHATGSAAADAGLPNFHNYFPAIYQARYVSGIVAGLKMKEMLEAGQFTAEEAKMGYVAAFPIAEIISGFTAFYLGARSVCPEVTMVARYTNNWGDMATEKTAAEALIAEGCKLISQHADTVGAPTACEALGVPCVGYNIDMTSVAPNTALISPYCLWSKFVEFALTSVMNGESMDHDWSGGFAEDAVAMTALNTAIAPEGTQEAIDKAIEQFKNGELIVFSTDNFTVNGEKLTEYVPVESNMNINVIVDGQYGENLFRSAPCFDVIIDGITVE